MTKKELKKWLKRCGSTDSLCTGCPFGAHELCFDEIKLAALALIKKQEQEIKQLKTECTLLDDELRNARQETINFITEQEKKIEQLTEERNRYAETLAKYQMGSNFNTEDITLFIEANC